MLRPETTTPHQITRTLRRFALPSIASVWVFSLYGIVDGIFVGQGVGPQALAAVNLSLPFVGLLFAVSIVVTIGAATAAGILRGEGNHQGAGKVFSLAVSALGLFGLIACVLSYLYLDQIAWLLGARGELVAQVTEYLSVLLLFNTAYLVSYALEVFCKVDGFPGRELLAVCLAALTNIVLDYLFIMVWDMGLTGAALATGLAQCVSFLFLLLHFSGLLGRRGSLRFSLTPPYADIPGALRRLAGFIRTGLPDGLTEVSMGLTLLAFNNAIAHHFGVSELAAFSVLGYLGILMLQTYLGLTQGMQPIISYLSGKGDSATLFHCLRLTLLAALLIGAASYLLIALAGHHLAALFLNDPALIQQAHQLMLPFATGFIVMGLNIVLAGFFTAQQQPLQAGAIAFLRAGPLIALLLILLPPLFSAHSIWLIPLYSELAVLLLSLALLYQALQQQEDASPANA